MYLTPNETWSVIDASKIQCYQDCPRQYFFNYILGWRPVEPNVHLHFGTCMHLALEHLMLNGYSADSIMKAYEIFETEYRKVFPPESDELNKPKIPANVLIALPEYARMYAPIDSTSTVLHTEVAGTILIDANKPVQFRMDTIMQDHLGIFSLEHKTTGGSLGYKWADQWRQKMQVGVYSHVLYCLYPEDEIFGVKINGICIKNPPQRSNAKGNEYLRVPIRKTLSQMNDWLEQANFWYDNIVEDTNKVAQVSDDEPVMCCFHKNTESCTKYFGCPFIDYCEAWQNPIQHVDNIPTGFHVDFWDPRKLSENAKFKVDK